jgi:hypothetical protein
VSPYHQAALAARRDITEKETAPTAEARKKLLKPAGDHAVTQHDRNVSSAWRLALKKC